MNIQELSDRLEINELLNRYARSVDRKDWDLYREVFTPDADIDYTSAGGIKGDTETQAAWLAEALAQFPATQHMVANVSISFTDDDNATVEAMFHNPMIMPDKSAWVTGGWYHHEVRRTSDGWRSVKLVEESAYFSGMPTDLDRPE
ncbi:MAG: nuclear transport factor 2 family protein [Acidimicrobiales bacterium]